MSAHVAVIAGGFSYERELSLRSGQQIVKALNKTDCTTSLYDIDSQLISRLETNKPDAVFLALHGAIGEDGSLREVLELLNIPYVGTRASAARIAWDKPTTKYLLRQSKIPTPDWICLPQDTFREFGAEAINKLIIDRLSLPLVIKPSQGGSSLGTRIVTSESELSPALMQCFGYHPTVLIEQYICGQDVAVSVYDHGHGPQALPVVKITPNHGWYDYGSRYTAGASTWQVPANLPAETLTQLESLAVIIHQQLGLADLSRIDFMITQDNVIYALEANVSPGTTETSLLPMAVRGAGLDFGELIEKLINCSIERGY